MRKAEDPQRRYGIGEWYGRLFHELDATRARLCLADEKHDCAFRPGKACSKRGGVCSLREYTAIEEGGAVASGGLVAVCPERFEQQDFIYRWIGEEVLGTAEALALGKVGFLKRIGTPETKRSGRQEVGQIDNVLVHPDLSVLQWCAVELQAVYFSGGKMSAEFEQIASSSGAWPPFPDGNRRPDFRSSGPKRLMPQLQIKVPALRRWGKKMAVVVDKPFFEAMAPMAEAGDMSNAEIIWFVVGYSENAGMATLTRERMALTTLERAVEGLTAGTPMAQTEFENRIAAKAKRCLAKGD